MDHDAARERLVGVERKFKALPEFVRHLVPGTLVGDDLHESARRFERPHTGGEPVRREQRGHESGPRRGTGMKGLGHRPELLAQADRLRGRDAERHRGALRIEREQARAARGGAEHAGRTGDVPAAVVVVRVDSVADAAGHVDAEHQRVDDIAAARAAVLGQRKHRRGHRSGGMDDGLEVRVVEIERVRGDAVDERRARHVDALGASEHRRLRGGLEHRDGGQRRLGRFVRRGADRAADPVVERTVRFAFDRVAPAARRMPGHEAGEDAGDRRRLRVGGHLRVACHGDTLE